MAWRIPVTISLIVFSTGSLVFLLSKCLAQTEFMQHTPSEYIWVAHGIMNILSYLTLILPGYLAYKYVQNVNYMNLGADGFCVSVIRFCFGEEELGASINNNGPLSFQRSVCHKVLLILFHFFGLQVSYLTWGVLQEKVMTMKYNNENGDSEYFTDSQFLVFVNRILAFCISGMYIFYCKQYQRHRCPLYKYMFCSISNIMSSWCQYEALKYVSFPHQVLAKAAKTIPVMIMGKIVYYVKYEYYEYVTSGILSIGMLLFMLDAGNDRVESVITTFSGVVLLFLYIIFDSFTSNWQGALFKTYNIKPIQMMCFVNLFSCLLTSISLIQQGTMFYSISFMLKYPQFIIDCILLSVCSATGQLFIFSTISKFGPLVFALITTIRQGFSILLSCILYNHHLNAPGFFGVTLVFISVIVRIYCSHKLKTAKKNTNLKPKNIVQLL